MAFASGGWGRGSSLPFLSVLSAFLPGFLFADADFIIDQLLMLADFLFLPLLTVAAFKSLHRVDCIEVFAIGFDGEEHVADSLRLLDGVACAVGVSGIADGGLDGFSGWLIVVHCTVSLRV